VVDADVPVLSYEETEALEKSETYSVTSEESYKDKKVKRRLSGSSRDSGSGSLGMYSGSLGVYSGSLGVYTQVV